jgi:hypothetical protein
MPCCGQKRAALANSRPQSDPAPATRPTSRSELPPPAPSPANGVRLRYLHRSPVLVRGASTGLFYRFSAEESEAIVDACDAAALERTGFFQRL